MPSVYSNVYHGLDESISVAQSRSSAVSSGLSNYCVALHCNTFIIEMSRRYACMNICRRCNEGVNLALMNPFRRLLLGTA